MTEANRVNVIRHSILERVARAYLEKGVEFGSELDKIPYQMRPKGSQYNRCCIYKDRAIIRFRCVAALGFRIEDEEDDSTPWKSMPARLCNVNRLPLPFSPYAT